MVHKENWVPTDNIRIEIYGEREKENDSFVQRKCDGDRNSHC